MSTSHDFESSKSESRDRRIDVFPRPFLETATPFARTSFNSETLKYYDVYSFTRSPCKVIFIGDYAAGKTTLIQRFCKNKFIAEYRATVSAEFEYEQFEIASVPFNMQFWDTAGQERFKCMVRCYYRSATVIVVVFALDKQESLHNARNWITEARKANLENPLFFLVGTKKDVVTKANYIIMENEAIGIAREMNAEYWSLSSKTGECVNNFFKRLAALSFDDMLLKFSPHSGQSERVCDNPVCLLDPVDEPSDEPEGRRCFWKCY